MSALRAWTSACVSALCGFVIMTASSCGTEAVGIDDCRDIEKARCSAGQHCGLVSDVTACERFYRDQCLHGLAVKPPANATVERCVSSIVAAGNCAAGNPDALLADCPPGVTVNAPTLTRACDVVLTPEKTEECAFLTPEPLEMPDASDPETGGSARTAGASNDSLGGGGLL